MNKNETLKDELRTVFVMQMGQFVDHDFAHSPNFPDEPSNCCDEKEEIEEQEKGINCTIEEGATYKELGSDQSIECEELDRRIENYNERCFPIPIPEDDAYFKSIGRTCMDVHRAISTPNLNCELGKREQVKLGILKANRLFSKNTKKHLMTLSNNSSFQ